MTGRVTVVGGGLSGIACARRLHDAGVPVVVYERAHRLGGRLAVRTEQLSSGPHPVDLGAPYFTVRDKGFQQVVDRWETAGLARPWTDSFMGQSGPGPLRWSAANGMRSLAEDLAEGLDVRLNHEVRQVSDDGTADGEPADAVVLAMPDPQAERLLNPALAQRLEVTGRDWSPVLSVWSVWPKRWWPEFDGAFVAGSPVLTWVSDDGRSRGDAAAVLVAHTSGDFARSMADDAERAIASVLAELPRVLGGSPPAEPLVARMHRWALASAGQPHDAPFALLGRIGVCGDDWGPKSRVEQAWISGDQLASALLEVLTVGS